MKCEECHKFEATFHSMQKINGVTTQRHLCSNCQKKYSLQHIGYPTLKTSGIGDFFSNLTAYDSDPTLIICPECGTTSADFLDTGYVGCSKCYECFSKVILPVVKRVQNDVKHVGKVPPGIETDSSSEYEHLKRELNKVLEVEDYEQAMKIRDKMRQIKN